MGGQLVEGIAAEWRQITLRERAAKHTATEVLEGTPPAEGCQAGWFNHKDDRLRPSRALASPSFGCAWRSHQRVAPAIPTKAGKGIRNA